MGFTAVIDAEDIALITDETFADNHNVTLWNMTSDPRDMSWIGHAEMHRLNGYYADAPYQVWQIEAASWGDHCGDSYGRSNHRSLLRDFPEHVTQVGNSTSSGYSLAVVVGPAVPTELEEAIHSLTEYPLYDEGDHNELESEATEEAWNDWLRMNVTRELSNSWDSDFVCEHFDSINEEWLKNRFYELLSEGEYNHPHFENATSIIIPEQEEITKAIKDEITAYCEALVMNDEWDAYKMFPEMTEPPF